MAIVEWRKRNIDDSKCKLIIHLHEFENLNYSIIPKQNYLQRFKIRVHTKYIIEHEILYITMEGTRTVTPSHLWLKKYKLNKALCLILAIIFIQYLLIQHGTHKRNIVIIY